MPWATQRKKRILELVAKFNAQGGLSRPDQDLLKATQDFFANNVAYFEIQRTRRLTPGYSLADSPVGLLAWFYEKLVAWTDDYPWTPDGIFTKVCRYRFSRAGADAPQNQYHESYKRPGLSTEEYIKQYSNVPLGISIFPREIVQFPLAWNLTLGPVVFERRHDKGGNFAAWENLGAMGADLHEMFGKDGGAYKCVTECSGYKRI